MHDEREEAHHHIVLSLGSLRGPWDRGRADRQTGGRDGRTGWADRRAGRAISISLARIPVYVIDSYASSMKVTSANFKSAAAYLHRHHKGVFKDFWRHAYPLKTDGKESADARFVSQPDGPEIAVKVALMSRFCALCCFGVVVRVFACLFVRLFVGWFV